MTKPRSEELYPTTPGNRVGQTDGIINLLKRTLTIKRDKSTIQHQKLVFLCQMSFIPINMEIKTLIHSIPPASIYSVSRSSNYADHCGFTGFLSAYRKGFHHAGLCEAMLYLCYISVTAGCRVSPHHLKPDPDLGPQM